MAAPAVVFAASLVPVDELLEEPPQPASATTVARSMPQATRCPTRTTAPLRLIESLLDTSIPQTLMLRGRTLTRTYKA
jgi:hypothetical protein